MSKLASGADATQETDDESVRFDITRRRTCSTSVRSTDSVEPRAGWCQVRETAAQHRPGQFSAGSLRRGSLGAWRARLSGSRPPESARWSMTFPRREGMEAAGDPPTSVTGFEAWHVGDEVLGWSTEGSGQRTLRRRPRTTRRGRPTQAGLGGSAGSCISEPIGCLGQYRGGSFPDTGETASGVGAAWRGRSRRGPVARHAAPTVIGPWPRGPNNLGGEPRVFPRNYGDARRPNRAATGGRVERSSTRSAPTLRSNLDTKWPSPRKSINTVVDFQAGRGRVGDRRRTTTRRPRDGLTTPR